MGKTLYVTDLDGTLLSADSRVTHDSAQILNSAVADGALFSIATARTPSTVASLMAGVKARLPFIVMTGAAMWDPVSGSFSRAVTIPTGTAEEILGIIRRHDLPAFAYRLLDGKIHIYHTGPLSDDESRFIDERTNSGYKIFHIPPSGESDFPAPLSDIALFYAMQPSEKTREVYLDIMENADCNPIFYHDMFGPQTGILEVFSPEASKAAALRVLKTLTGADRVVAFGDNLNDIPMLREADVAVAVGNAVDPVKEIADTIIGCNTSDSVARFILEDFHSSVAEIH